MNIYVVTVSASQSKSSLQTSKKPFGGVSFSPPPPLAPRKCSYFHSPFFFLLAFLALIMHKASPNSWLPVTNIACKWKSTIFFHANLNTQVGVCTQAI